MSKSSKSSVYALVDDYPQAEAIVDRLKRSNFVADDISVLLADKRGTRDFAHEKHTKAPEGATAGVVTGGVVGGVLGWLVGIGSLAIPGVGPLIAAGPILSALSVAAVGATAGGITGALVGLGVPEYEARQYEEKIKSGNILISVHSEDSDETKRAKQVFKELGAKDIAVREEEAVSKKEKVHA